MNDNMTCPICKTRKGPKSNHDKCRPALMELGRKREAEAAARRAENDRKRRGAPTP